MISPSVGGVKYLSAFSKCSSICSTVRLKSKFNYLIIQCISGKEEEMAQYQTEHKMK